jgi:hypothetical protein
MSLLDHFRRRTQDVHYTRVLVCSLGDASEDALNRDFNAYRKHLESVTLQHFEDTDGLVNALRAGYDIVHVLTVVAPDGTIGKGEMTGTELIERATQSGTKLLWIGTGNDAEGYIKGFKPNGNRLNLVMTIDRRENRHSDFIEKLFLEMQSGLSMPVAWNRIAPQIPGKQHPDAPYTIFYSGIGQIRFV